jgi:hypothetical protein
MRTVLTMSGLVRRLGWWTVPLMSLVTVMCRWCRTGLPDVALPEGSVLQGTQTQHYRLR